MALLLGRRVKGNEKPSGSSRGSSSRKEDTKDYYDIVSACELFVNGADSSMFDLGNTLCYMTLTYPTHILLSYPTFILLSYFSHTLIHLIHS